MTVSKNGAGQSVTRTITSQDAGTATAVVRDINIDVTAPTVKISGPRVGAVYKGSAPQATCVASDALSGVASCTLVTTRSGAKTVVTATAVDRAGNSKQTTVSDTVM